ncbi:hypothetical protein [Flavobacterium sp. MDT1-60]|uniref:hypothetical protein n=1 Tax=Flavobacterium sp. MDT1-60 TaxID=1979344 RepID=UPI00178477CE|nr:hypothetical protein [Flavobacterium sp. MDT1-60]QOG02134.1 hypothetical protein IHE43_20410 [Flavobacterium sp. MDT1-60]
MDQLLGFLILGTTLLLAFLIFANLNQANSKVNRWFGCFILCIFLLEFNDLLEKAGSLKTRMLINDFIGITDFIIAPVFYFSVSYFIKPTRKWRVRDNLHFIFAFIILFLLLISLFIDVKSPTVADKKNAVIIINVFNLVFCLQVIIYCVMAYGKIIAYQKKLFLYTSNMDAIDLKWLKQVVVCILIITGLWLIDNVFKLARNNIYFDQFASLIYLGGIFLHCLFFIKTERVV